MLRCLTLLIATSLVAAIAVPALAQRGAPSTYEQQQRAYEQAMTEYQQDMVRYEKDRADYDKRYGPGAYDRRFGVPQPPAPPAPMARSQVPSGPSFVGDPGPPYIGSTCARRRDTDVASLVSAVAGSLGSRQILTSRTEGAVLGALIDGTLGANLASGPTSAQRYAPECDADGFFFTSDQTFPYREAPTSRRGVNGRYDELTYVEQGCRLAVGAVMNRGRVEYRYARVCPDSRGRLRFSD